MFFNYILKILYILKIYSLSETEYGPSFHFGADILNLFVLYDFLYFDKRIYLFLLFKFILSERVSSSL